VRFIPGTVTHRDAAANCEVKVADCACNPYLAAAALMAMALDGISKGAVPPPPVDIDPQFLSEQDQRTHGVRRLPADLETALRALEKSSLLYGALGDEVVDAVVAVRRAEAQELADLDLAAKIAALRWMY
jgi:glutamine synthetase